MNCEECGNPATHLMFPTTATDDDRSNGPQQKPKRMCDDCAREAFESGEWESDEN
jgi:hypothetical protein